MTSKLKVNLINDSGDNNLITSDGSGSVTLGTAFPAKFGQIIYGTYNTATNTSSTSYVDTGLNANITPSATSSKVLVMAKIHGMWNNGGAGRAMLFKILRDSTEIQNPVLTANFIGNVSGIEVLVALMAPMCTEVIASFEREPESKATVTVVFVENAVAVIDP